jgi:hypothetical protein
LAGVTFILKPSYARKGFLPGEKPQPKKDKELMGVTTKSKLHALVLLRITKKTWVTLTDITASEQNLLGLHKIWRTKKWQVRVLLELFGVALVDSFLLARKFIPRWKEEKDTESVFWKFVMTLLPQVAAQYDGRPTISQYKREQVLIGKQKVEKGKSAGRVVAKQMRYTYCIKKNKKRRKSADENTSSDSGTPTRSRRTAYTCISHREAF